MRADDRDSHIRYPRPLLRRRQRRAVSRRPLEVGAKLLDGGDRYRVERVEPPPSQSGFGHAWATRIDGSSF
jgi:hypothetical protein